MHRNVSWLTLGLAGFVLLIACANLGNLQLARSAGRARDLAIRTALGASRSHLVGRMMSESIVLALMGGGLGLLLARTITDALAPHLLDANTSGTSFPLDARVFGFAAVIAVLAGVLTGGAPAWLAARADVNAGLKQQARGSTGNRSRHRIRQMLIIFQLAFSLALLAGAGFFIRGLQRFMAHDPGWQVDGLLKGTMPLPSPSIRTTPRVISFTNASSSASRVCRESNTWRWARRCRWWATTRRGRSSWKDDPNRHRTGTGGLRQHREFRLFYDAGHPGARRPQLLAVRKLDDPHEIVINETMARRFWPGESAVGKRIRDTSPGWHPWLEIVGVVRDVTYRGTLAPCRAACRSIKTSRRHRGVTSRSCCGRGRRRH